MTGNPPLTENLWCRLILIHTPGLRIGESGGWFSEIYLSRHILSPNHLERQNIWPLGMLVVVLVRLGLSWKVPLFLTGWHPLDEQWTGKLWNELILTSMTNIDRGKYRVCEILRGERWQNCSGKWNLRVATIGHGDHTATASFQANKLIRKAKHTCEQKVFCIDVKFSFSIGVNLKSDIQVTVGNSTQIPTKPSLNNSWEDPIQAQVMKQFYW